MKIITKFFEKIGIPLIGIALPFAVASLFDIFDITVHRAILKGLIGFASASFFLTIIGCVSFIKWLKAKGRLKNFKPNNDGSYTCPFCRMDNVSFSQCERCGFDPSTIKNTTHKDRASHSNNKEEIKSTHITKQKMLFCNICGAKLPSGSAFCNKCGSKIADDSN